MRTLSRLMIAAGILGAIVGTGGRAAMAQGVYIQGPGFGVDIGRPAYRGTPLLQGRLGLRQPAILLGKEISPRPLRIRASLA